MKGAILILGATSAIARAAAMRFAENGHPLYLAGRDDEELSRLASDLYIRYGSIVKYGIFDAEKYHEHFEFLQRVNREMEGLQGALLAFGELEKVENIREDIEEEIKVLSCNYVGACAILHHLANDFSKKQSGFIAGISSVAGDRGRQSNYVYGSAKGGLSLYLQGLRNRLFHHGVQVVTIKPGFVDTAMTFGLPGMFLVASPESVGRKIVKAIESGKDVVYIPWFWRFIMLIIKLISEKIFKRLKL